LHDVDVARESARERDDTVGYNCEYELILGQHGAIKGCSKLPVIGVIDESD